MFLVRTKLPNRERKLVRLVPAHRWSVGRSLHGRPRSADACGGLLQLLQIGESLVQAQGTVLSAQRVNLSLGSLKSLTQVVNLVVCRAKTRLVNLGELLVEGLSQLAARTSYNSAFSMRASFSSSCSAVQRFVSVSTSTRRGRSAFAWSCSSVYASGER